MAAISGSSTTSTATSTIPSDTSSSTTSSTSPSAPSSSHQWIHILRHGERRDFIEVHTADANWHRYDPPLSPYGHTQATEAGVFIGERIAANHFTIDRIICSPFIRTVETAWNVVKSVRAAGGSVGPISIEYGVAEWHPATWIKPFLPQKTAVQIITEHEGSTDGASELAASAIDTDYKTLFGDEYFNGMINDGIGETLEAAAIRAVRVVDLLTNRFPHQNLLIVTHAIHSIGLTRALLRDQSFPVRAGVCSITSVQRPLSSATPSSPTAAAADTVPSSPSSPTSSSSTSSSSSSSWNVIHNGLSSYMSGAEQNLWLIPGEEERIYGVRKVPRPHTKVPLYEPLTDEEKAACAAKQATVASLSSSSTTKTVPPPVVVSSNVSASNGITVAAVTTPQ